MRKQASTERGLVGMSDVSGALGSAYERQSMEMSGPGMICSCALQHSSWLALTVDALQKVLDGGLGLHAIVALSLNM